MKRVWLWNGFEWKQDIEVHSYHEGNSHVEMNFPDYFDKHHFAVLNKGQYPAEIKTNGK